jgi:hypothetical protein
MCSPVLSTGILPGEPLGPSVGIHGGVHSSYIQEHVSVHLVTTQHCYAYPKQCLGSVLLGTCVPVVMECLHTPAHTRSVVVAS